LKEDERKERERETQRERESERERREEKGEKRERDGFGIVGDSILDTEISGQESNCEMQKRRETREEER